MTRGVGGSSVEHELSMLGSARDSATPIGIDEYTARLQKVRERMKSTGVDPDRSVRHSNSSIQRLSVLDRLRRRDRRRTGGSRNLACIKDPLPGAQ